MTVHCGLPKSRFPPDSTHRTRIPAAGARVAAALGGDDDHHACAELLTGLHLANRQMPVPGTVVAEVGSLLAREGGARIEAQFLSGLAEGDFHVVELTLTDFRRMAQLVEQYADLPLGTTDASIVAVAERLRIGEIATLDRRHFTVVRPRHADGFQLLP